MRRNDLIGRQPPGAANPAFVKTSGAPSRLSHPPTSTEKSKQLNNHPFEQSRRSYPATQTVSNKQADKQTDKNFDWHPEKQPDNYPEKLLEKQLLEKQLDKQADKQPETAERRNYPVLGRKAVAKSGSNSTKSSYYPDSNNYLQYKDYTGKVEFSANNAMFYGKVIGIKSLIPFEGDSVSALFEDFYRAIDEYLSYCAQNGVQPEKPFKGTFNVRIGADLHRKAALAASERGISLNALVENAIRHIIER